MPLYFVLNSTLDPVLRLEQRGITPQGIALVSAVLAYLLAKPGNSARLGISCRGGAGQCTLNAGEGCAVPAGVLAGAVDYYILDKFQRLTNSKVYTKVCPARYAHRYLGCRGFSSKKQTDLSGHICAGQRAAWQENRYGRVWDGVPRGPHRR